MYLNGLAFVLGELLYLSNTFGGLILFPISPVIFIVWFSIVWGQTNTQLSQQNGMHLNLKTKWFAKEQNGLETTLAIPFSERLHVHTWQGILK